MVSVDGERCVGCGICEQVCPADVFKVIDGKASVGKAEDCLHCGNCEVSCPAGCIIAGSRIGAQNG